MTNTTYDMTHNRPEEGAFLVYINGVEIPVQSASVRMAVGEYPSAEIVVAPDANLIQLGAQDRVEVAIFYKDNHYTRSIGRAPDFRLIFDGVIVGWSYTTAAGQRHMRFSCVAHAEILDHVHPELIIGPDAAAQSAINASKSGAGASLIQSELAFPWSIFFFGLVAPEPQAEGETASPNNLRGYIRRPYDIINNMLRAMVGTEARSLGSVVSGVFFSRYMRKVVLPHRFLPSPLLETEVMESRDLNNVFPILKGVQDNILIKSVQRKTAEVGISGTIWSTFQNLFQSMYYDILSISTPPIVQVEMTPLTINQGAVLGPPKWTTEAERAKDLQRRRQELVATKIEEEKDAVAAFYDDLRNHPENRDNPEAQLELETKLIREFTRIEKEVPARVSILEAAKNLDPKRPNILANHITKPQWLFGIPPACNVVFPSMINELQFEENYVQQPTRMYVNDKIIPENFNLRDELRRSLSTLSFAYPNAAKREMWKKEGNPIVSGKNFLIWPEEFYSGPTLQTTDLPQWLALIKENIDAAKTVEQEIAQKALEELEKVQLDYWNAAYAQAQQEVDVGITYEDDPVTVEEQIERSTERFNQIETEMLKKFEASVRFQTILQSLKDQGIVRQDVATVDQLKQALTLRGNEGKAKIRYLQNVYARYEYHRQRSAARNGIATLAFNPYIVPGFPAMFFDYLAAGQHFIGYVTSVSHSLSTQGMQTTVQYVHGQTLDELAQEIYDARMGNNIDGVLENLNAGPPQPIPELREVMQEIDRAEDYFSLLFHQGASYGSRIKRAAFDVTKVVRFVIPGKTKPWYATFDDIFDDAARQIQRRRAREQQRLEDEFNAELEAMIEAQTEAVKLEAQDMSITNEGLQEMINDRVKDQELVLRETYEKKKVEAEFRKPTARVANKVLDNYAGITPDPKYRDMFGIHDVAMAYVSRPVCTLEEYINFRGKWGTRRQYIPANDKIQGKGAGFYERIMNLTQGPGTAPTFDENNFLVNPTADELPDTRLDWHTRLLNYRKKVLFGREPAEVPKEK